MAWRFFVRLVGNVVGSLVAWLLVGYVPAWIAVGFIGEVAWLWAGFVGIGLLVSFPGRLASVMRDERREHLAEQHWRRYDV